jgi:hypothetical protein
MEIVGDYHRDGYALVKGLIPPETGQVFLHQVKLGFRDQPIPLSQVRGHQPVLNGPTFELYGSHYPPLLFFLWGLTPTISALVGRDLLPTYDYFRFYRYGDICRVHYDRPSCEHSLSLTLGYSDGRTWSLELGKIEHPAPSRQIDEDFGDEPYSSIPMAVGDAVLYHGVQHRHGRLTPNPNRWSAHLFLHWVERGGVYADHAYDRRAPSDPVDFSFS